MTNWDEIRKEWETTEITFKDLAEKHGIKDSTIRSRKNREKWQRNATNENATQRKNVATVKSNKSPPSPRKRSGNPNPKNQFTKRNKAAEKHGFFSKYLPEETLEIMEEMNESSPADLIWDQIQIQYAAIIRAQKIMFVADKNEMIKELKKEKESENSVETEWEFQFAWERQAQFLNAQSRAISELRSSINQFIKLSDEADERRLKLEQMQLNIDKTKAEIDNLNDDEDDKPIEIVIKRKGERS